MEILKNISIAGIVLIITLILNIYGKGMISSASILIGMIIGYIICIPLGMVDFTSIKEKQVGYLFLEYLSMG